MIHDEGDVDLSCGFVWVIYTLRREYRSRLKLGYFANLQKLFAQTDKRE